MIGDECEYEFMKEIKRSQTWWSLSLNVAKEFVVLIQHLQELGGLS